MRLGNRTSFFFFFSFLLLYSELIYCNNRPSRSILEKKIKIQNRSVQKIEKSIIKLEKKLGIENEKYLEIIQAKKIIDQKLIILDSDLTKQKNTLENQYKENNRMMAINLVQNLSNDPLPSDLLVRKIFLKELVKNKGVIKRLLNSNKILKKKIGELQTRFGEYTRTQNFITQLLKDFENQKSILAQSYISKIKEKESLLGLIKNRRKRIKIKKLSGNKNYFYSPLSSYESIDFNKKGVKFRFLGRKPVKCTKNGTVVYSGKLATYGDVVMIDHGDNTRSIILGEFSPSSKKGAKLKRGQIIGHTRDTLSRSKVAGKLYFEVRKKNKVQNTILLMDRKFLKKNNLINLKS